MEDKVLQCTECGIEFIFSIGEQEFFRLRNLANVPKRCSNCRLALRFARAGRDVNQLSEAACAECSRSVKVPFKPKGYRPIYCNDCMAKQKAVAALVAPSGRA